MLILLFIECSQIENPNTHTINVSKALKSKQKINLSTISKNIEYVQLETNNDFIVGNAPRVFADDEFIIVVAYRQQYIFSRKTGAFIREIGNYGRNPEGYRNTRSNLVYDEVRKTIYASGWDDGIIEYSVSGDVLNTIMKPHEIAGIISFVRLDEAVFFASVKNIDGIQKQKLIQLNKEGKIIKSIPNTDYFINTKKVYSRGENEGWFYWIERQLLYKSCFNDTIFEVKNNSLRPKYIFSLGKFKLDYSKRELIDWKEFKDYFLIENVFESADYLFFTLNYNNQMRQGIYIKKKNTTIVADSENVETFYFNIGKYGFINDIDNFIQFYPQNLNQHNELIGLVQAYELKNWFSENPKKVASLPPCLQKIQNINENDNPVVMIAKLKE